LVTSLQDDLTEMKGKIQEKKDEILKLEEDAKEAEIELTHLHKRLTTADDEVKVTKYDPIKLGEEGEKREE
jgi:hypothetical protein